MIIIPPVLESPKSWSTWFDLDENGGVLDFHEPRMARPLSLYVVVPRGSSKLCSWWETTDGTWIGPAFVGVS
jgi:hypothetical protein